MPREGNKMQEQSDGSLRILSLGHCRKGTFLCTSSSDSQARTPPTPENSHLLNVPRKQQPRKPVGFSPQGARCMWLQLSGEPTPLSLCLDLSLRSLCDAKLGIWDNSHCTKAANTYLVIRIPHITSAPIKHFNVRTLIQSALPESSRCCLLPRPGKAWGSFLPHPL